MRTLALSLLAVMGVVSVGSGVFLVVIAHRDRDRVTRERMLVVGLGVFFLVIGSLALIAFAVPSARDWAIWAIAILLIARGVASFIANRVIRRRDRGEGL